MAPQTASCYTLLEQAARDRLATDPAKPGNRSRKTWQHHPERTEMSVTARDFRLARQLTRHSQADVAKALGVAPSTVARWESGEREAPEHVYEWLMLNRHQSFLDVPALTAPGEARGHALRAERAAFLAPFPEVKEAKS